MRFISYIDGAVSGFIMKKIISLSIFLIGFTAMAGQIIFMREFLTVFYGNELSVSLILANWLVGGAIGSFVLGRFTDRIRDKAAMFSTCQLVLSVLLPASIIAVRFIKNALNVSPGEIIPFFPMLLSSFIILAPFCIILGFMFSLACRMYEVRSHLGAISIGKVYVLESIGAMAGGVLASFILIRLFNSFQIGVALCLLNVFFAFLLISENEERHPRLLTATVLILAFFAAMWLFGGWNRIDKYSLEKQWKGYNLLASKNSIYGNIAVTKRGTQISFFDNGLHLYTVPNELVSEESVHFALLEHPGPRKVLLIGGGVGGLAEEIIKHPIEKLDYVELDPLIIKMARQYLPWAHFMPLEDKRVSIISGDGRYFIKTTEERYDCVIIALGDPCTAQLNRFYTAEFFNELSHVLNKGGIVSFGVTSSESYIGRELNDFLSSIYVTLKKSFSDVLIIPGDTAYFLASGGKSKLTYDYRVLMERARKRGMNLQYVREYYLFSKLSPQKTAYIKKAIIKNTGVKANYDFRPISYYYDIIFWSSRFRDSLFSRLLKAATEIRVWAAVALLCIFIIFYTSKRAGRRGGTRRIALIAVMACGFSSLAFQVLILISFQILYGYLFYKLGIILTSFMVGLALGGLAVIKAMSVLKKDRQLFIATQCAICIYPLVLPVFLFLLSGSGSRAVSWIGSNVIFFILPAIAGFIGGFQFPLANKIYLGRREEVGRVAGLSYGVDLFGSCLGALLTGAILIPILGIPRTCLAISLINLAVLPGLFIRKKSVQT